MKFAKLIQKIKENKKIFKYIFIFSIMFLFSYNSTFAATPDEIKDTVSTVAAALLSGISMILALFTYLTTMFISPAWVNGSLFGMNTYFHDLWILVSNLVYFVFAFVLIWIAFMNIVGKTGEHYELKKALPKFIVGVLIVPFSWYLVQFILSISAVLTISGLTLPFETFDTFSSTLDKVKIPKNCTLNLTSFLGESSSTSGGSSGGGGNSSDGFFYCDKDSIAITEVTGKGKAIDSVFGIISMYTYGILAIDTIDGIDKADILKNVKSLGDLIVKIVFDLLFVFIYSLLMIAIGIVLMIRGIYIWVFMILSPVFGLMYFFGSKEMGKDGFFSKFTLKNFVDLALVPVFTMLALSFGLLFLYVVGSGLSGSTGSVDDSDVVVKEDSVTVGQFKLNIKGQVSKLDSASGYMKAVGGTSLGIVGSLILKVFGIVVLWGTIMAALKTADITKIFIAPFEKFGQTVSQIATQAPGNIPIFGGQSLNSLSIVAGDINSQISTRQSAMARKMEEGLPFMNAGGSVDRLAGARDVANKVGTINQGNTSELKNQYEKLMNAYKGNPDAMRSDPDFAKASKEIAEKLGIKDTKDFKYDSLDTIAKTVVGKIEEQLDKTPSIGGIAKGTTANTVSLDSTWLKNLVEGTGRGGVNESQSGTTNPATPPTPGTTAPVTYKITVNPGNHNISNVSGIDLSIMGKIQGISSANRGELETKLKAIPEVAGHADSVNLIKQILDATYPTTAP